jgi:glutathione peroxidase
LRLRRRMILSAKNVAKFSGGFLNKSCRRYLSTQNDSNFYSFKHRTVDGKEIDFSSLAGKVVLIENVASLWGTTTRDYTQLNDLVKQFGDKLQVLAFPCNQFGHQENTNNSEILKSLSHVRPGNGFAPTFPVFEKIAVNGAEAAPTFTFLKQKLPTPHDEPDLLMMDPKHISWSPVNRSDVMWNFEKFLIDTNGQPFRRYSRFFETKDIAEDISSLLK